MTQHELCRRAGHPSQLYGVRRVTLQEGAGKGADILEVHTAAGLSLEVLPDTGLDIGALRYKGHNISFISKNGSPTHASSAEGEFLPTFPAGMLYTCGLRNVGPPCHDGGEFLPQHGRIHGLAATQQAAYIEDDCIIIRGTLRESQLFGPCLQLSRTIRIPVWGSEVVIEDTVESLTPKPEEFMLLYHVNFGFPMLSEQARLILPEPRETTPRTDFAAEHLGRECSFDTPIDGEEERVYFHKLPVPTARLDNPDLGIQAELSWSGDTLPILTQWRSMASGDYVLGLEPCNCYVMGRSAERENGTLQTLQGFETRKFSIRLKLQQQEG